MGDSNSKLVTSPLVDAAGSQGRAATTLQRLVSIISSSFFYSPVTHDARQLYSLPNREGGLNNRKPTEYDVDYAAFLAAVEPLQNEFKNIHLYRIETGLQKIMHDASYGVRVESSLQLIGERFYNKCTSTADNARLDIKEKGFSGVQIQ